jgi:hypothetical protein
MFNAKLSRRRRIGILPNMRGQIDFDQFGIAPGFQDTRISRKIIVVFYCPSITLHLPAGKARARRITVGVS